jgi:drug/metabolite transporter (DMT)-like permease
MFGSTLVVSRFSVGQFEPTTYISLRLSLAGLLHATIYALSKRRHWPTDPRLWRHAAVLGILGTAIPMTSIVTSLQYQSSGITSLLITTNPALTVLFAHFFLADEKLNLQKGAGIILALGGAALLAARGESGLADAGRVNPLGYILVLVAMLFGSSMTVYARRFMSDLDAFDVASVRMLVASLTVFPISAVLIGFTLQGVNSQGFTALAYASLIGTFSGMMLTFYIIKRFGATTSAMTAYIVPVVATVLGVLFLDETITPFMLVGMAFIGTGITLINRSGRRTAELIGGEAGVSEL